MRKLITISLIIVFSSSLSVHAQEMSWVEKSNAHAQVVLEVLAKFSPEGAGSLGVDGLDELIMDLGPGIQERSDAAIAAVGVELERRLAAETDVKVKQDLGILIKAGKDNLRSSKLNYDQMLPYFNISQPIFYGVRGLIDPQIPRERYPAAISRIEKYAGLTAVYTPLT